MKCRFMEKYEMHKNMYLLKKKKKKKKKFVEICV